MGRPCFLVVDREFASSISTRKLVIETAKFNVITAYSSREAVETLERFPAMTAAVVDAGMRDMPCDDLVHALKTIRGDIPVIVISAPGTDGCVVADHHLESFEPGRLLELLRSLVPEAARQIESQDAELARER